MSPQPAAAPAGTPAATPASPHKDLLDRIAKKVEDKADLTAGERQIDRAMRLERERSENMKRIAANREYLRLMEENEELGDAEADWLDDFYPSKEKGAQRTDEEIERTRKAKQAARG